LGGHDREKKTYRVDTRVSKRLGNLGIKEVVGKIPVRSGPGFKKAKSLEQLPTAKTSIKPNFEMRRMGEESRELFELHPEKDTEEKKEG